MKSIDNKHTAKGVLVASWHLCLPLCEALERERVDVSNYGSLAYTTQLELNRLNLEIQTSGGGKGDDAKAIRGIRPKSTRIIQRHEWR